jgi:CheY-like chemotaxis protein
MCFITQNILNNTEFKLVNRGKSMTVDVTPSRYPTLLVISSDRANLKLITQLMTTRADFSVQTATTGMDGLKQASAVEPAVIVMDTGLSDTCSKVVLKALNENPRTSRIPVIAVSSDALESQVHAGLRAGFYRYLTKPYKLPDLLDAIDDSLRFSLSVPVLQTSSIKLSPA